MIKKFLVEFFKTFILEIRQKHTIKTVKTNIWKEYKSKQINMFFLKKVPEKFKKNKKGQIAIKPNKK